MKLTLTLTCDNAAFGTTDEERRNTIDDLAAQAREMTDVLAELFGQMRGKS